jgi:hypothetical protein
MMLAKSAKSGAEVSKKVTRGLIQAAYSQNLIGFAALS